MPRGAGTNKIWGVKQGGIMLLRVVGVSSLLISALFSAARAADAPLAAPAPPPPAWTWTGCYVGGNVDFGGGSTQQSQNRISFISLAGVITPSPAPYGSETDSAIVGGGQAGCDYQFGGGFVVGVQGEFDWGSLSGSHASGVPFSSYNMDDKTKSFQTAAARVGYAFASGLLPYAKGGAAWVQNSDALYFAGQPSFLAESASWTATGYTVGAGLEWRFAPNWSIFAEYNYMNFGTKTVTFICPPGINAIGEQIGIGQTIQTALVGVNWRFNWLAASPLGSK